MYVRTEIPPHLVGCSHRKVSTFYIYSPCVESGSIACLCWESLDNLDGGRLAIVLMELLKLHTYIHGLGIVRKAQCISKSNTVEYCQAHLQLS